MNMTRMILNSIYALSFWLVLALVNSSAFAAGLLTPADGSLPPLAIRDHAVSVIIEDGYAITTVEQVFHNPHGQDLEARYSFPVPEHGAVAEFTLWIDGKPVSGEVLEKQVAKKIHEEEKAAGRETGLTEKDSYKTFEIRVWPVRAGQNTRIRMVYLQPAHIDTGIGRYVYPLEEGGTDEQKLAFWTRNDKVTGTFSFDLKIKSAYPVDAVRVPAQASAVISQQSAGEWQVHIGGQGGQPRAGHMDGGAVGILRPAPVTAGQPEQAAVPALNPPAGSDAHAIDKDVVVYWRHKAGLPGSIDLVTHKPESDARGTFMLVVTPGDDLKPITRGRDWIFVLDVSGSMQGKYSTLADGVNRALGKMRPEDRFRIVLFNDRASELTPAYVNASPENVRHYSDAVSNVSPGNGTNLYAGLRRGIDSLEADRTSAIVLVTDGVANVGETHQRKFIELIRKKDVRLFTFIMGNSSNRPMLEALTKASHGFAINVSNSDDIVGQILSATSKVSHEALHGVRIRIEGIRTADITPAQIGSLYRGQQLVLFGHYWGDGPADVHLTGKVSGTPVSYQTRFSFPLVSRENPELERLWAYARIDALTEEINNFGEKPDIRQAVTDLGVEYGLVTDYTSMLVVRDEVFAQRGIERRNQQRLAIEQAAQKQRAARPAASRRVDTGQPMYGGRARASHGGGSLDPVMLILLALLLLVSLRTGTSLAERK